MCDLKLSPVNLVKKGQNLAQSGKETILINIKIPRNSVKILEKKSHVGAMLLIKILKQATGLDNNNPAGVRCIKLMI